MAVYCGTNEAGLGPKFCQESGTSHCSVLVGMWRNGCGSKRLYSKWSLEPAVLTDDMISFAREMRINLNSMHCRIQPSTFFNATVIGSNPAIPM